MGVLSNNNDKIGPNLGPNCLPRLLIDDTGGTRVKGDRNPNNKYVLSERAL